MIPEFMKMSDDFYVYLRELKDANDQIYAEDIVAYRNGKTWYNKDGQIVTDPEALAKEAGINQLMPYLEKAPGKEDITKVNYKAFSEYTPTFANGGVTLSPRIAFSFAVGEQSLFSASYNVITSWSAAAQSLNPVAYLFFKENAAKSSTFSNPGLKPERSVNYEVGFKQLINKDMSMEFAAYYSERKDQVVAYQYSQAYPNTYISYTNMDFGTVQGFILGLNMRAGEKKRASFRANYTLQFAKGTGSDRNSTLELLRSGQPNLRQLTTLNADQRHKVNLIFTYVFGPGDGPTNRAFNKKKGTLKEYKLLQNAGVAVQLGAGSGLPYTRSSTPYSTIISNQGKRSVEGAINGSRMPWLIDGDIRIFKGFVITLKKDDKGKIVKTGDIQVALSIQNVIGYKNETQVYSYSGKRIDDGYLTAREFQQYITTRENPASFIDYYTILMEGTNPYGAPRTFKVDVSFSF
jgi:outer membrane receptor protein involved in Fe transport